MPNSNLAKSLLIATLIGTLGGCQSTTNKNSAGSADQHKTRSISSADAQLNALMDEVWQYRLSVNPTMATGKGTTEYDHLLSDLSNDALAEQDRRTTAFVKSLNAINRGQLSSTQIINLDILVRQLNNTIDQYRYKSHYTPLTAESGFHASLAFLPSRVSFKQAEDYQNYMARLRAIPKYFEQNIHWMKEGLRTGNTHPQEVLKGFESGIEAFIVNVAEQSVFYKPFKRNKPLAISDSEFEQLKTEAAALILDEVVPSYRQFYDFMVKQYIPGARQTIGVSNTTDGTDFYNNRVKYYTTTDKTAEQVHQIGLKEVARIRSEMDKIITKLEFKGSFADFIEFLRTDKQFYPTTAEQLLKEASYIAKKMDAKLPTLFKHLPRTPYGVAPVPAHLAPKYTIGRYVGASRDDTPGYYWVNTYALETRPLYVLEALTLHEAVPGHHLQNAINRELTDVPNHRRYSYISAFGEGWGLYSEYLGIEAGFYQDPYSDFGRLTYEMWRACRLVVDTGMHIKGWSRQKAIDFLQSNTALSKHNVRTEIDRYITWPGQALSYKMGELTIKRLRREAQAALGDKFDIREFHDEVLKNGSVPLKVLEQLILAYIERTLKN
jgi:uncharacterized protein (DUF885 family)